MSDKFEDYCWKDIVDDEILEIYQAYHRDLFVGPRPAVLAIDLYKKAYEGGNRPVLEVNRQYSGSCGENAWKAVEPTKKLFSAARAAGVPIIYTTRHADTNGVHSTNRQYLAAQESAYAILDELAPMPGELVIYKERASGFFGTPLVSHLRRLGVESLIICGESTSGCVRASTVDAYSYAFHNVLVEECTFDRSMLSHKVNLFDLHHKYADVMHVADVVAHLDSLPRSGRLAAE
ncbi:MAG TPA: isochorismatase family protein [Beijerinckiaceae bacterium]|jgi:nicotinamidase-related amidase|nr:isochorismatase family protein [Beijerinckiaceae bacterium]